MFGITKTDPVCLNVPSLTLVHVYRCGKGLPEDTWHVIDSLPPTRMVLSGMVCIVGGSVSKEKLYLIMYLKQVYHTIHQW